MQGRLLQPSRKHYGGQGYAKESTLLLLGDERFDAKMQELWDEHIPGFSGKVCGVALLYPRSGTMISREACTLASMKRLTCAGRCGKILFLDRDRERLGRSVQSFKKRKGESEHGMLWRQRLAAKEAGETTQSVDGVIAQLTSPAARKKKRRAESQNGEVAISRGAAGAAAARSAGVGAHGAPPAAKHPSRDQAHNGQQRKASSARAALPSLDPSTKGVKKKRKKDGAGPVVRSRDFYAWFDCLCGQLTSQVACPQPSISRSRCVCV